MSRRPVIHLQKVAGIAGSETHLLSLLPALRARGWDVRMLMLHEREPGAADFARELRGRGVPVDAIRLRADVDPLAFVRLAAYLVRRRPALLHTHLVHGDVYGQLAGVIAGVPVRFSTKHGFNEFREERGFALADRLVASLTDTHIAVSRGLARYLAETEGFSEDDFQIVHYGIETREDALPYRGPPRLLCIGRLIPIKGHLVLLRAFAGALEQVPELELRIAGRGPLDGALRAVAAELGVADELRFLGHVFPIQHAIEEAGIVVVPSLGEGFGMVALEAMERRRPVIASAVGGLIDIVEDGVTGLLVTPGEVDPLRDAIVGLVKEPGRAAQMGDTGRRQVMDWFGDERTVDRTELLYRARLDGRRARATSIMASTPHRCR
jgi:glycosyltransferase involved in cell wall biosynthesis